MIKQNLLKRCVEESPCNNVESYMVLFRECYKLFFSKKYTYITVDKI